MDAATPYIEPLSSAASAVFKRRGRWYATVPCPICESPLRVRLSLGPMVARCEACREDVEADVTLVVTSGRA
ncbi:MAG TPA: hypothetical protein VF765_01525 [Polyangiaceae bacterium]